MEPRPALQPPQKVGRGVSSHGPPALIVVGVVKENGPQNEKWRRTGDSASQSSMPTPQGAVTKPGGHTPSLALISRTRYRLCFVLFLFQWWGINPGGAAHSEGECLVTEPYPWLLKKVKIFLVLGIGLTQANKAYPSVPNSERVPGHKPIP